MMIFGNDGFRSKYGEKYMTIEFINAFTKSLYYIHKKNYNREPILIGRDTRYSGKVIEDLITSTLNYYGIDTIVAGVIPTPTLSTLLLTGKYSIGIMITASHNKFDNNGIKLFDGYGNKLSESTESIIEKSINKILRYTSIKKNKLIPGKNHYKFNINKNYINKIIKHCKIDESLNYRILIDCSNGAFYEIVKSLLINFDGIDYIHDQPDGFNINYKCGALESSKLLKLVNNNHYDYGIAFDGDGDRSVFVSRKYGVIEIEKLIFLFSNYLKKSNNNKIVTTEICNKGLEDNCKKYNFNLLTVKVGDRNVINKVNKENALLGAEPSGHFYFPNISKSMDGLITSIYFFKLLSYYGDNFTNILNSLIHYNRITKNIPIKKNITDIKINLLKIKIQSIIDESHEKLIIRKSMWDPVFRVYYDYSKKNNFKNKVA